VQEKSWLRMLVSPSKPLEPSTTTQRRRKQYVLFVRLSVALMASLWVWKASLRYGLGSSSDQPYETESLKRQGKSPKTAGLLIVSPRSAHSLRSKMDKTGWTVDIGSHCASSV
jgi:hypothetical protein